MSGLDERGSSEQPAVLTTLYSTDHPAMTSIRQTLQGRCPVCLKGSEQLILISLCSSGIHLSKSSWTVPSQTGGEVTFQWKPAGRLTKRLLHIILRLL